MKLKQLRISGFKSFCDETEFRFDGGLVSMIVGPNGCGKSNVADALGWALGEQSPRSMRGASMSDVIFNGSSTRKAVNLAEVSVLFDNRERKALEKYNDFSEIAITRRLYRSGESEYLINNVGCRLMDVRELLMDTGAAGRAYSIVEQGRVESFVSASAEDRRQFMEEAAGVMRYKTHRLTAERKLEQTQQNLRRVDDVLSELYRQEAVLSQQVKNVQQVRNLQQETEQVQLALGCKSYAEKLLVVQSLEEQLDKLKQAAEQIEEGLEASLKTAEIDGSTQAESLQNARAEQEKTRQILQKDQQQLEMLTESQPQSMGWKSHLEADLQKIDTSFSQMEKALKEKEKLQKELVRELNKEEKSLQLKQNLHDKHQAAFTQDDAKQQQQQERLFAFHDQLNGINHRSQQLSEQLNRWKGSEEALMNQFRGLQQEKSSQQGAQQQQKVLASLRDSLQAVRASHGATMAEEKKSLEIENQARERHTELEKRQLECTLRFQALKEMQDNLEGFTGPVKSLFAWLQANPQSAQKLKVCGVMSDLFTASKEVLRWAGTYLASFSGWVVIESSANLLSLANLLEKEQIGGISFVALDRLPQLPADEGVSLASRLRYAPKFKPLFQALFGNVMVHEGEKWAEVFASDWHKRWKTDSEWLSEGIAVHMGLKGEVVLGLKKESGVEVLQRRLKLEELEKELGSLANSCKKVNKELEAAGENLKSWEQKRIAHQAELEEKNQALMSCEQHWHVLQTEQQRFTRKEEQLQSELNSNRSGQKILASERDALISQIKDVENKRATTEKEVNQSSTKLGQLRQSSEEATVALSRQQALCIRLKSNLDASGKEYQQLRQSLEGLSSQRSEQQIRQRNWQEEEIKKKERKKQLKEQITQMKSTYTHQKKQRLILERQFKQKEAERRKIAVKVHQSREKQGKYHKNKHALELKLAEEKVRLEQSAVKVTPLLAQVEFSKETTQKISKLDQDAKLRYLFSAEIQILPEALSNHSRKQLEQKLLKNEHNLQKFSDVNMTAPKEHQKLTERTAHMKDQQADLQSAIKNLHDSILRLNQESQRRFLKTFKAVNTKFEELFVNIFGGGEARLMMTQKDDPLNTGVDIYAHPPGKKLQNINLLSGGEKALTSIALIFAFFLHKPSPFCLLDEVDAPLDDVNIARFNRLLKSMTKHTQFIIITHNKRTMEVGDTLYGVTMEKAGVSRIVSVRLPQ